MKVTANGYTIALLSVVMVCLLAVPAMAAGPVWTAKPAWNGPYVGYWSLPTFADLDGDGDYDLLIGTSGGNSLAYENTGTASSPIWTRKTAWDPPDIGWDECPAFVDLDGDGDYDLLIGTSSGNSLAYENTGTASSPIWTRKTAWDPPSLGFSTVNHAFADLDFDGDYDVLIGEGYYGNSLAYENTGTASSPIWTRKTAWDAPDVGFYSRPAFADLDFDGDYDLLIGESSGNSLAYENTGTASSPIWTRKTAWDAPDIGKSARPAFADLDGDGDCDLLFGQQSGPTLAYENTGALAPGPDLTPTAITVPALTLNEPSTITATIANIGVLDAPSFNVSLSADGNVVGSTNVPSLSAGTSTNVSFEWAPISGGRLELCIDADSDKKIKEMDEANNKKCILVTVPAPDLTPTAMTAPTLLFVNEQGTINATIANIGVVDASAFSVSLSANGSVIDTVSVTSLGAGNSTNVSFEWTPASVGYIEFCVVADSANAITELDEANNEKCIVVTVNAPDLTPTVITAPPLFVNQPSTITTTIANIGVLDAPAFNVSLVASGSVIDTASIPSLDAGNSINLSFEWTPTSVGYIEFCVVADSDTAIAELDEANNEKCIAVTINAPDLTPTAITAPPLFVNQPSTITATIDNIGEVDASAFNVSLVASGSVISTANVPSLNAGNSTNVSFVWTQASAGDYELCTIADIDNEIVEMDETNNEKCIIVRVEDIFWQHGALKPWDAERLSTGNTLIAEYGNHTVIEVTPAGETVWQYGTGTQGSGANELNSPADAERLPNGNTLIVDRNNHRVIEVNTTGDIMWQYGTTGELGNGTNQLYHPMDVEQLDSGNMLIADRLNNRVIEVDRDKTIVWEMTGLNHPFDADRLDNGNTLVVEYKNHRVIEINTAGEILWQYGTGTPGSGVNELNYPADAERLSNGNTQIVDAMNDRVIEVRTSDYDPEKGYNGFTQDSIVWEYGSNYPLDADRLSNNYTLISEAGNDRVIEVFTPEPKPKEHKPLTPILISGYVNDVFGQVNDPTVIITNLNTSEVFTAETIENSSYYQVLTSSEHVCCAGNALHFNVSDNSGNKNITVHVVTEADLNAGGFEQDITVLIPYTDMVVTAINSYHNDTRCPAWFNLSNEVDVTIENTGTTPASGSNVSLYIDGEFFGKLPVPGLNSEESTTVTFLNWMPVGEDCLQAPCEFAWSYKDYNFTAVADCDNDIDEHDEANNETTVVDRACYNGYMADDPLENVAHGMLNGGVLFMTGDSVYTGLYSVGSSAAAQYDITLPEGASVELAHLNVYYTWHYLLDTCPQLEVSITNATGTYIVPLKKAYNDHKCTCPGAAWVFPWGNYVYDVTDYIRDSGSYTVTVTRTGGPSVCVAGRGINLVYEDQDAPLIEYWINEGADVLMGGRRYPTSSNLAWWENINNATFSASTETGVVVNATLGVAAPWAGSSWDPGMTNYLFFNDVKLGTGVYHGYGETYDKTIDSITMHVGSTNAQVGLNVTSITDLYLKGSDNVVGQCDDGDNMMPCNAFLVVEYESMDIIPAGVTFDKKRLNLNSTGILKAFITLPEDYNVTDINVSTVTCENASAFDGGSIIPGKNALEVKFKIPDLEDVPTGDAVLLTVEGKLFNGIRFEGSSTLKVV